MPVKVLTFNYYRLCSLSNTKLELLNGSKPFAGIRSNGYTGAFMSELCLMLQFYIFSPSLIINSFLTNANARILTIGKDDSSVIDV